MKRNLRFLVFLLAAMLVASSLFPLTFVRGERLYQPGGSNPSVGLAQESPALLVQGAKDYSQDIDKVLRHYDKVQLDPARSAALVHQTRRLSLPTSAGNFDLTLELRDMRSAGYKAQETLDGGVIRELEDQPVRTYKGSVAGMPEAQARLTIDEDTLEGLIITPGQIYFIEPAKHYSALAQRTDFVIYKQSDLLQASIGECGVTLAEKVGAEAARVHTEALALPFGQNKGAAALFSPPRTVDLATEADFEYFTAFGSSAAAANNEIIGVMNQVEGIYNTQFGLQFSLVFQNVWATAGDPYSSTDASLALNEFTSYWNANHGSVFRDLAHMWTGKSFDGSTIGIAWLAGLDCPLGSNSYGMSERRSFTPDKFIVTAHEIGHSFNATHSDAQPGCANTIMGTTLNPSTSQTFCAFSVNEIDTHANAKVACLSQALTPGCTYTLSASSRSLGSGGGNGSVNVSTIGSNCVWAANSAVSWITITAGNSGTNGGTVSFSVASNSNGYARTGLVRIAEQDFLVTQAGGAGCTIGAVGVGQTVNGGLVVGDCFSSQREGSRADQYSFTGFAGAQISIELSRTGSSTIDTYLYLIGPSGGVITENDDVVFGNLNSRIPTIGFFTLPVTGTYVIEATSFDPNETGTYSLVLSSGAPILLTEEGTNRVAAVDSVTHVRGPFQISALYNFSGDRHTRVILFTSNLGLTQPDPVLTVQASGVPLTVENVGTLSGVPGLDASYIVVRLPDGLQTGDLALSVALRGLTSNTATLSISP